MLSEVCSLAFVYRVLAYIILGIRVLNAVNIPELAHLKNCIGEACFVDQFRLLIVSVPYEMSTFDS